MSHYNPTDIETKWHSIGKKRKRFVQIFHQTSRSFMFSVCFLIHSGAGLHVGHPLSYTAVDIIARYKRMHGFNVLNPMGWDAFGLPAERAAVRENRHPAIIAKENTANFKHQLLKLGFSFDWDRE